MTSVARRLPLLLLACAVGTAGGASAQDRDSVRLAELERQMEAVTRELERLRLGRDVVEADSAISGLGPAASKVYRVQSGVSIGGYGEILYENFASERQDGGGASTSDRFDALRAIVYVGYKFNDRVLFNSEIEIEHADEAFLEFAYVDYRLGDAVGIRGGALLVPMGLVNELHEPPVYLGTERTVTESSIIPTTWRENGVGLFGGTDRIEWRAYVVNGFDGSGFTGAGLRGGRQKASQALANDLALTGRIDYVGRPGLSVGAAAYVGQAAQDRELAGEPVDGRVVVWDLHGQYERRGLLVHALVAGASVSDVAELNALNGLSGAAGIGSRMLGWNVQVGYDLLAERGSGHQLIPYLRHERVDTQREVAAGFSADPANDRTITSLGLAWKPVPQVVAKLGYQLHSNRAETGLDQLNVQLGWLF